MCNRANRLICPNKPLHIQISSTFRLAIATITLKTPQQTLFFFYKFVQSFKPICSIYGNAPLQNLHIHLWDFMSFCFHLLLNKRSITDIHRNYDKPQILSLFATTTHWFSFDKVVHQVSIRDMNPLGLSSDYSDALLPLFNSTISLSKWVCLSCLQFPSIPKMLMSQTQTSA